MYYYDVYIFYRLLLVFYIILYCTVYTIYYTYIYIYNTVFYIIQYTITLFLIYNIIVTLLLQDLNKTSPYLPWMDKLSPIGTAIDWTEYLRIQTEETRRGEQQVPQKIREKILSVEELISIAKPK